MPRRHVHDPVENRHDGCLLGVEAHQLTPRERDEVAVEVEEAVELDGLFASTGPAGQQIELVQLALGQGDQGG